MGCKAYMYLKIVHCFNENLPFLSPQSISTKKEKKINSYMDVFVSNIKRPSKYILLFMLASMELSSFFLVFILLPSIRVLSHETITENEYKISEAMVSKICENIWNQRLCFLNIKTRLKQSEFHDPYSIVRAALEVTLDKAQEAVDMVTTFNSLSISLREQIAIQDCKELLDFSVSELSWSLAEMNKIRGGLYSDPGNLKAWLSAALSNQDTCLEGFEGTNHHVEGFIRGSLAQVTHLIGNVLTLYSELHRIPFKPPRNSTNALTNENKDFPEWMTKGDKDLLLSSPKGMHVDTIVALDGTGHYRSIWQAINEAPSYSNRRYVIYIKRGVYNENIDVKKKKTNIMLMGEGIGATAVTGNRNFMQGWTTFRTATVAVSGKGFIARDMTFRNTAGPTTHQAVALRVNSDQSAFYRCSIEGYQDTLYIHSLRQFYRECSIYGTLDFIFGNGAAVLQDCKIFTREPLPLQKITITAQGRKDPHQSTGFSIQDSYIYATQPTYLGRPWKQFSRTVYLNTYMSGQVQPRGWLEWYGNFALNTLWYGEYMNYGPGAGLSGRVKWPGYHIIKDAELAKFFTVERFINGLLWLPATGVKFLAGLGN